MERRRAEDRDWTPAPEEHFTGRVWFGPMTPEPSRPEDMNVLGVLFEPGARTDWHSHPGGQVLYVLSGSGQVRTRDGESVAIGPGDVVNTPPGEVHWHGSTPASFMMHLSITAGGPTEWLGEKVGDEDYGAP